MEYFAQQTMNAFAFGAEYALLALGLAIVFSIMGLVNFAHGEMIAVGGYSMVAMAALSLGNPLIVIGFAILAATVASVTLERVAFRPVRYADPTTGLLTAFGVSINLQNLFLLLVSPRPIAVTSLYFLEWSIDIGMVSISSLQLFEAVTTIVVIVALMLFLRQTSLGLAMRAAAWLAVGTGAHVDGTGPFTFGDTVVAVEAAPVLVVLAAVLAAERPRPSLATGSSRVRRLRTSK